MDNQQTNAKGYDFAMFSFDMIDEKAKDEYMETLRIYLNDGLRIISHTTVVYGSSLMQTFVLMRPKD